MRKSIRLLILIALLISGAAVGSATAGMISIDPTNGVTWSSDFGAPYGAGNIVDGSGLSGGQHGTSVGDMWLSGGGDTSGFLVFDLGAVYSVTNIHVWNGNQGGETDRGVSNVVVKYGTNLTFGFDSSFESTLAEVTNFAVASGATGYTGEAFDGFLAFEARYVLFDIVDTHGDSYTSMSEVQFSGTFVRNHDPIPEITNVTVESVSSEFNASYAASKTVDNSGLNILGHHSTLGSMWLTQAAGLPEVVYDLGDSYDVEMLEVWNYQQHTFRGVNGVDISGSADGTNFSAIVSTNFTEAPGNDTTDFSQTIPITATARYIKLDVTSQHVGGDGYYGLSEIKFYGAPWEPPPAGTVIVVR